MPRLGKYLTLLVATLCMLSCENKSLSGHIGVSTEDRLKARIADARDLQRQIDGRRKFLFESEMPPAPDFDDLLPEMA